MEHTLAARPSLTRLLLRSVSRDRDADHVTVDVILTALGDRSFGWAILLFALVNLIPMPPGSNVITGLPLVILTGQMALGYRHIHLSRALRQRQLPRRGFRRVVIGLRPIMRPIERVLRRRHLELFHPRAEQKIGCLMLVVAIVLFLPIPLSGYPPALSLFVTAIGLIERDGLIAMIGMGIGVFAILLVLVVVTLLVMGVQWLI